jgi:D-arabinose 1-dehydrogenase-like Zn-dependent alcohol dehydrogenase
MRRSASFPLFVVHLPETIAYEAAVAMMLKGLTAQYLLRRILRVEAGQTVLVQAAAAGVGVLLTQWAKHLGATVIGAVGSPGKAEIARQNGCDHVVDYRKEDKTSRCTQGRMSLYFCGRCLQPGQNAEPDLHACSFRITSGRSVSKHARPALRAPIPR